MGEGNREIVIRLPPAEALVLFEFLSRTSREERKAVTDKAEMICLWNLEASLEPLLPELFASDYAALLADAKRLVVGDPD